MALDTADRLRAILSRHLTGDALDAAVSDLVEAEPSAVSGTLALCTDNPSPSGREHHATGTPGTEAVAWTIHRMESSLTLEIGRLDGTGEALLLGIEVRGRHFGRETTGQVSLLASIGGGDFFLNTTIEDRSVRVADSNRDRAAISIQDQALRLRGPSGDEVDLDQGADHATIAKAIRRGKLHGTVGKRRWALEVPADIAALDLVRIAGLVEVDFVRGHHPDWRLLREPTAHELARAQAMAPPAIPLDLLKPPFTN